MSVCMLVNILFPHLRSWVRSISSVLSSEIPCLGPNHSVSIKITVAVPMYLVLSFTSLQSWMNTKVIRQEGRQIDGSGFLKPDLREGQEKGLALCHIVIREPVSWCFLEEGLNYVMRMCEYKILTQS